MFLHCDKNAFQAQPIESNVEEIIYQSPYGDPNKFHLAENFDDLQKFNEKWIISKVR